MATIDPSLLQVILDTMKSNSEHIAVINGELGSVNARLDIIQWFLGINVAASLGVVISHVWSQVKKK